MLGFSGGSDGKESICNAGDPGSIPGLGRYPGEGNDHPVQYFCLENPMDRGAGQATVHGAANICLKKKGFVCFFLINLGEKISPDLLSSIFQTNGREAKKTHEKV